MKRVISSLVKHRSNINEFRKSYTANDIVQLLSQIEELKNYDVFCSRGNSGQETFIIGKHAYSIVDEVPTEE